MRKLWKINFEEQIKKLNIQKYCFLIITLYIRN